MEEAYLRSFALFFALFNPFLMSIYLLDLIRGLPTPTFARVLIRGSMISACVFVLFAWGGEAFFRDYLQVRFASFQIFGGIVFLLIGLRYVFSGAAAIESLRDNPTAMAGSIAMPIMIGPGTVSAAVVIGTRLPLGGAAVVIVGTLILTVSILVVMKVAHDKLKERHAAMTDRYIDLVGRMSALLIGTIAIDMILTGLQSTGFMAE
ncbi:MULTISPECIES: MarC family protein [Oxalobacteraceae]|uniref:MarC family protein n=1 Tax=Herminiimonas sp. Marseille-P9896 TaxID=2742211 RepID=UPI00158B499F|nr:MULTISPECIES: MarC family protein [Oxalobacteraceae]